MAGRGLLDPSIRDHCMLNVYNYIRGHKNPPIINYCIWSVPEHNCPQDSTVMGLQSLGAKKWQ